MSQNSSLYTTRIPTNIGEMLAYASDEGLYLLEFSDNSLCEKELKFLLNAQNFKLINQENDLLKSLKSELSEYFDGRRKEFSIPLILTGTGFQIECWNMLQQIPYGESWTYQQQAKKMSKLPAIRAMAAANGSNKIAVLVPCHRVIGVNGKLTGYRGGLERKRWLLQWEMQHSGSVRSDYLF